MNDRTDGLTTLFILQNPKAVWQLRIVLVMCAVCASIAARTLLDAPMIFSLLLGGFFLLPLTAIKGVIKNSEQARQAYEAGNEFQGTATWTGESWSDSVTWTANMDLNDGGQWRVTIARGYDTDKALKYPGMDGQKTSVTAWIHPESLEPRFMQVGEHFLCIDSVTKILPRLRTAPK